MNNNIINSNTSQNLYENLMCKTNNQKFIEYWCKSILEKDLLSNLICETFIINRFKIEQ